MEILYFVILQVVVYHWWGMLCVHWLEVYTLAKILDMLMTSTKGHKINYSPDSLYNDLYQFVHVDNLNW